MAQNKIQISVSEEQQGQRLDKFLAEQELVRTRARAQYLIEKQFVLVNGKLEKNSYVIKNQDLIEFFNPATVEDTEVLKPLDFKLDIHFEDSDLIVINKPAGLVVHPAAGHAQDTLVNALLHHTQDLSMKFGEKRPGIVHRIDRDTSGLLVIAKNDFAHENLAAQFKQKSIHRLYYALVQGEMKKMTGTIQSYLHRHPKDRKKYCSVRDSSKKIFTQAGLEIEHAKWAVSHFKCLKKNKNYSYVQMKLETGRTHQIRIHLSEMGHPIYGDETYGFKYKKNEPHFNRFLLHAAELGFAHPRSNVDLQFKCEWPSEQKKFIESLFL